MNELRKQCLFSICNKEFIEAKKKRKKKVAPSKKGTQCRYIKDIQRTPIDKGKGNNTLHNNAKIARNMNPKRPSKQKKEEKD